MTIPLDRLYHYIESVAQDIRGDAVIIYRFTPHGSKKVEALQQLRSYPLLTYVTSPHMYCNDQEPLDYEYYQNANIVAHPDAIFKKLIASAGVPVKNTNFKVTNNVYDKALLLHSEERSVNLAQYQAGPFIPVYYWSHAVISLEWFRFAQHINQHKKITKQFLVYNRAWSGTREYRLKFVDLLIAYGLHTECQIAFNSYEPELNIHYTDYQFTNSSWKPINKLEDYFDINTAPSHASADFDLEDYEATEFEVVLETLFDDARLHLTEKVLRPVAVGQPFLHVAPHGSLAYLRRYGFKTFDGIIDEGYDTIQDPALRLEAVVMAMKSITKWTTEERQEKTAKIKEIVDYNRKYFFSDVFFNFVITELTNNLKTAFQEQEDTNTGVTIDGRKSLAQNQKIRAGLLGADRSTLVKMLTKARKYYNK